LCCLLTYGCLLSPHQEIRLLKWSDFSDDLSHINLGGNKVKSKRNRIVPVPSYVGTSVLLLVLSVGFDGGVAASESFPQA